jgi:hypothetical protein
VQGRPGCNRHLSPQVPLVKMDVSEDAPLVEMLLQMFEQSIEEMDRSDAEGAAEVLHNECEDALASLKGTLNPEERARVRQVYRHRISAALGKKCGQTSAGDRGESSGTAQQTYGESVEEGKIPDIISFSLTFCKNIQSSNQQSPDKQNLILLASSAVLLHFFSSKVPHLRESNASGYIRTTRISRVPGRMLESESSMWAAPNLPHPRRTFYNAAASILISFHYVRSVELRRF